MRLGTVKQFDNGSSYGFIEDDQNHKSYFVFYTAIKEEGYKRLEERDAMDLKETEISSQHIFKGRIVDL